ncbi:hypothetical protein H8356DRAFT_1684777 [Neocallimastix lanati (nom. inval.)]|uniref:Uncharacterized protein n=1 Tax=Neocallimastix californiae TaxID=1754190 RepID=A0A1Y2AMC7_9FUNG|nr:hypothetical protein H8356DRAFT_1684777 [Neocallimastix sp. JGI-2020a]ORY23733.1 hypothetical protein LY90DRAFT_706778 [Neocallimastix californiae]|eukprot:ORY23733.1 hypothetical protein LY90DRAFT_706778 [Neocallimastix californiae]
MNTHPLSTTVTSTNHLSLPTSVHILKKSPQHKLKVKQSIENLNKRGVKRTTSHLCLQSSIQFPDSKVSPSSHISKYVLGINNKVDDFKLKESKEEYNKLLKYFGSVPHNQRVSNIKEEYQETKDYMSFEIQNQNQIMEAIKNGEIPFYSSDNDNDAEVLVINDDM